MLESESVKAMAAAEQSFGTDGGEGGGKCKRASPSRMHTEMPWLRSGWCGRSGGVAWVHAATRLREREQMASERASCVPSLAEKEGKKQGTRRSAGEVAADHTGWCELALLSARAARWSKKRVDTSEV